MVGHFLDVALLIVAVVAATRVVWTTWDEFYSEAAEGMVKVASAVSHDQPGGPRLVITTVSFVIPIAIFAVRHDGWEDFVIAVGSIFLVVLSEAIYQVRQWVAVVMSAISIVVATFVIYFAVR